MTITQPENPLTLTVKQAADLKQVTAQALYLAIRLKRLKSHRKNGKMHIFQSDLDEYYNNLFSRKYSTFEGNFIYDEEKGFYSVTMLHKKLGVSLYKIYYAIRKGILKAHRKNKAYVVNDSDLNEYKNYLAEIKKTG